MLPAITLFLFLAAAWAIHRELSAWTFGDIAGAAAALSGSQLGLAALAAALSYGVLALYDPLALQHVGRPLPLRRGALAGFIGYAWEHNPMHVSEADMVHFEDIYRAQTLP